MLENQDIICISSVDWEPLWTRKQQVMSRLPRSNRILYVEPPISILSPFKDPACWQKWRSWREGIRRISENIFLLSPPVVLPFGNKHQEINLINQIPIAHSVRKAASQLGMKNPILWTYLHNSADLVGRLGEKLVVYDCVDEHSAYQGFDPETVKALERKLLAKADIVFVTAQGLYNDKAPLCEEIHLLPNAADISHFKKANDDSIEVANELKELPWPVLGFVGVIKEWIDLDLIYQIALQRPNWAIVMIGPIGAGINVDRLNTLPNLRFLGHRDRQVLPNYLKGFDVCLNPFKMDRLTETVSPLKFYEYLASGKPIASVPMPEILGFSDVVEIGAGSEGFLQAIERALKDTPEKKAQRLLRAGENSWENRVEFMMEKISSHLILEAST
ncbi:MAG: glycosyltransferase [Acidobacteriota bacterium]